MASPREQPPVALSFKSPMPTAGLWPLRNSVQAHPVKLSSSRARSAQHAAIITSGLMRGRLASSGHFTEQPAPEFNRSSGRRGKVPARSTPALVTDSFKARPATASSAERQATVAREPETQPRRGLTRRPTGRITAGQLGPVGGTRYIFTVRALASCRRRPLSSNVRPHTAAQRPHPPCASSCGPRLSEEARAKS